MIAWAIVWLLLACLTALFAAMELINGSLEWRFWFCVIFVLILIMIPAFTIQEYRQLVHNVQHRTFHTHPLQNKSSLVFLLVQNGIDVYAV